MNCGALEYQVHVTSVCIMRRSLSFLWITMLTVVIPSNGFTEDIPSNLHSLSIIARLQPDLSSDVAAIGSKFGSPVFVRIFKEEEVLEVWLRVSEKFEFFRTYYVCDQGEELGPKRREGDGRSPEGFYCVTPPRLNPHSRYHLAIGLGYPNTLDLLHGRTGSRIMIHGGCFSNGCFAMTDRQIEEIYALAAAALRNGQPFFQVHIFPFRMTEENMNRFKESKWYAFWSNLKEGYDFFEREKCPPYWSVESNRYRFD